MADGSPHDASAAAEIRTPHVHLLKCWTPHFEDVFAGRKPFEIRRDDRGFAVGDILELQEFEPGIGYTGRTCRRTVTFKFDATAWNGFGLLYGHCVMALGPDPDDGEETPPAEATAELLAAAKLFLDFERRYDAEESVKESEVAEARERLQAAVDRLEGLAATASVEG